MAIETWSPTAMWGSSGLNPPGDGWNQTGTKRVQVYAPPKHGGPRYRTVPIYTRMTPEPPPPPPPEPPPPPPKQPLPTTLPTSTYTPPAGPSMADVASQFSSQLAGMQQGFQESLAQQAAQFAEMQQAQAQRMEALQQQMLQAQVRSAERPTVAGVKTATGSAGTDMQIARRGVKGAFGRAGMRIKSLNV